MISFSAAIRIVLALWVATYAGVAAASAERIEVFSEGDRRLDIVRLDITIDTFEITTNLDDPFCQLLGETMTFSGLDGLSFSDRIQRLTWRASTEDEVKAIREMVWLEKEIKEASGLVEKGGSREDFDKLWDAMALAGREGQATDIEIAGAQRRIIRMRDPHAWLQGQDSSVSGAQYLGPTIIISPCDYTDEDVDFGKAYIENSLLFNRIYRASEVVMFEGRAYGLLPNISFGVKQSDPAEPKFRSYAIIYAGPIGDPADTGAVPCHLRGKW